MSAAVLFEPVIGKRNSPVSFGTVIFELRRYRE
jgi:hypothetical protein